MEVFSETNIEPGDYNHIFDGDPAINSLQSNLAQVTRPKIQNPHASHCDVKDLIPLLISVSYE